MKDKQEPEQYARPAERQPLMNKLEPTHSTGRSAWSQEGKEWSKTGRSLVQMLMDMLKWLLQ